MADRKPHPSAKLLCLPQETKDAIYDGLAERSLEEAVPWVEAAFGIETSRSALSRLRLHCMIQRRLERNDSLVATFEERLKSDRKALTPEQIQSLGSELFETLALSQSDPADYIALQELNLKREKLRLEQARIQQNERRISLLEKRAAQAQAAQDIANDSALTPEERDRRVRNLFGLS